MVFVTGADSPLQDPSSSSSTRLTGGFIRLRASKHVGIEASMDFRTATDADNTIRVKSTPIQVSGLFYLLRSAISPYAVFGAGWYKTKVELVNPAEPTPATSTDGANAAQVTKFGYHTGFGGELMLGRHASIFVDYRYTFVNLSGIGGILGTATSLLTGGMGSLFTSMTGATGVNTSTSSSNPSASHLGSMWTTGMTIYF
jgi:hypothetical protein